MPDFNFDGPPTLPGPELTAAVRAAKGAKTSDSMLDTGTLAPEQARAPISERLSTLRESPQTVMLSNISLVPKSSGVSTISSGVSREQSQSIVPQGIEFNIDVQQRCLVEFLRHYNDFDWTEGARDGRRYRPQNREFEYADAIIAYGATRQFRPQRVMVMESIYAIALLLDMRDKHPELNFDVTYVSSRLDRLEPVTKPDDHLTIISNPAVKVPLTIFDQLQSGDILFIQSSHVVSISSDVNRIFFEILPRLAPGVIVHLQGVFYPFEYPADWSVRGGKTANEIYLLRAFLQYNAAFEILLCNDFAQQAFGPVCRARAPLWLWGRGNSMWLRKVK